jgi:ribonuclease BN (tRNA processing enzyme)
MRVTLLGTMGWMPSDQRETTCFACRDGESLLLFDAGTGLRRLLQPEHATLLDGAHTVHLFLTHFHLDHVCGLAYLPGVLPGRELVIHAPAAEVTGVDPLAAIAGLLRKPYNPRDWGDLEELRLEPVPAAGTRLAGHDIRLRLQRHSDPSVAYRVDDAFALATDTAPDPATADFVAGVRLLLHEAWYSAADDGPRLVPESLLPGYAAHSEAGAVARLAEAAGVGRLILMHLNPLYDEAYYAAMAAAARQGFAATDVLADGETVDTGARV